MGLGLNKTPLDVAFGVAFGIGGISALITLPLVPRLKKYVSKKIRTQRSNLELPNIEESIKTNQVELNIADEKELERGKELFDLATKAWHIKNPK